MSTQPDPPTDTKPSQTTNTKPTASSSSTSSRPPVTLNPTTHLDPGAYIRGTLPITIDASNLIHPRALLLSSNSPLTIGSGNIISEKASIGGPSPTSTTTHPNTAAQASPSLDNDASTSLTPTTIHNQIHIHPSATICHSATISSYSIIESHATILPGVTIGEHSKVCAGVTVRRDVPAWTVVWGDGEGRRSRLAERLGADGERAMDAGGTGIKTRIEQAEILRLKGMERERDATMGLLARAARAAAQAKRGSTQR